MENFSNYYDVLLTDKLLPLTERLFGKRLTDFEFTGIIYSNVKNVKPHIFYPAENKLVVPPKLKEVKILLTEETKINKTMGVFQLSHETIHLLSPTGNRITNCLEEGLAVFFSKLATEMESGDFGYFLRSLKNEANYMEAYKYYEQLNAIDKYAVIKLRSAQPVLAKIQIEDFKCAGLTVPNELIMKLIKEFEYQEKPQDVQDCK